MNFSGGINRPPYETADGYLQTTASIAFTRHSLFLLRRKDICGMLAAGAAAAAHCAAVRGNDNA